MVDLSDSPAKAHWGKIGVRQHHGLVIPLFSLHSNTSCGIGEYPDLIPLFPWCKNSGLDVIQLLPLNDTGHDNSPYNALSALALNPLHLSLAHLPFLQEYPKLLEEYKRCREVENGQRVDYKKITPLKENFLRQYYELVGEKITSQQNYVTYVKDHDLWLKKYALFKALKIKNQWKPWWEWPGASPSEEVLNRLYSEEAQEMNFHRFVQYLCYHQMTEVQRLANQAGVFLKGDIPILISRDSADVWLDRSIFNLDYSAGAPPDMYNKEGQNWGFPIYNWENMEQTTFSWWIQRLQLASSFYDLYRLDHIVGFYRIWSILESNLALDGKFIPEDFHKWIPQGEKILRAMLRNSTLLPIGEDLGTVPPEVRLNMRSLGICGTKVLRWERDWHGDQRFIPLDQYEPLSMTTVSTHDSESVTGWWKNAPEEAQKYAEFKGWKYTPVLSEENLLSILQDSHRTSSLFHINLLQEYLALIPNLVHSPLEEERINTPGVVSDLNWSYRFIPSVEEVITNPYLSEIFKKIIPNDSI